MIINYYGAHSANFEVVKNYINEYMSNTSQTNVELNRFNNFNLMIQEERVNTIYLIDFNIAPKAKTKINKYFQRAINKNKIKVIYILDEQTKCFADFIQYPYYCIKDPTDKEEVFAVLAQVQHDMLSKIIMLKTQIGFRVIDVADLNCVNIVSRAVAYHLDNGELVNGLCLRGSFEKAIADIKDTPSLYFMRPSLLINLAKIKILHTDHVEFINGEKLYYPRTAFESLKAAWEAYIL